MLLQHALYRDSYCCAENAPLPNSVDYLRGMPIDQAHLLPGGQVHDVMQVL